MKRKTVLKTIGVIAAGAALVGGGTFAAWSDFAEIDGAAGAGVLQLTVSNTSSGSTSMGFGNMAPGEFKIQELYVASNDAESVPNGTLTLDVLNLLDTEGNGLTATGVGNNCTTNSELAEEGGVGCGSVGEFSEDAFIQIAHKAAVGGVCSGGGYGGHLQGTLASVVAAGPITLDADVAPGEGRCIRLELGLADGPNGSGGTLVDWDGGAQSTNRSQGDSATFDIRLDLTQNI
ncbi:MAG TPA: TasA family protein [Nocardioides sp.]